ncbi:MAG: helix-turn-helix transcriptional regulator [Treponema sp.]|nr:helix-turn-helix transcriptional regulator [Treponema sp.]
MGIRKIFIQNLKYYRKQAGLTQEKLAEIIGMSTAYIGDMEARERFPSAETIDKIADALKVKPEILFCDMASPVNMAETFEKKYSASIQEKLIMEISKAVDSVCKEMTT